jgi:hypothetical protein
MTLALIRISLFSGETTSSSYGESLGQETETLQVLRMLNNKELRLKIRAG